MMYKEAFYSSSLKCRMKQIDKRVARKAYDAGYTIWLQPSNLIFDNVWHYPASVSKNGYSYSGYTFEQVCNYYQAFNCDAQRGRYIHFFIDEENYNRLIQNP